MSTTSEKLPFWKDEAEKIQSPQPVKRYFRFLIILFWISYFLLILLVMTLLYYLSPILMGVFLVCFSIFYGWVFLLRRKKKQAELDIPKIQQEAKDRTGAAVIGSAIHVAGHPLLEREQPVVLALTSEGLNIHSYEDPQPITVIVIDKINSLQTVVYDDERTPHIDTVDSNAQALQIVLSLEGKEFTCLFRRMQNVRPIDWYHAIQKAKWRPGQM